jgi:hypothetical protein
MNFLIEKLYLPGPGDGLDWSEAPTPHHLCEAAGIDAGAVLALVIAEEGGVQVGVSAAFLNGQAVVVARKGESLYALRAIPSGAARRSSSR